MALLVASWQRFVAIWASVALFLTLCGRPLWLVQTSIFLPWLIESLATCTKPLAAHRCVAFGHTLVRPFALLPLDLIHLEGDDHVLLYW